MSLVTAKEIANVIQLEKLGIRGTFIGWILLKTLRISKVNKLYEKHKNKSDIDFLNGILEDLKIVFDIPMVGSIGLSSFDASRKLKADPKVG